MELLGLLFIGIPVSILVLYILITVRKHDKQVYELKEKIMAEQQRNPNLMNPKAMAAVAGTRGAGENVVLFSEVLTKVNNAKDKSKKIAVLKEYDNAPLRQVLKGAFDPKIEWDLPEGTPPYKENDAPAGTEHTTLFTEARKLWHFVKGADRKLSKTKKKLCLYKCLKVYTKTMLLL